jgi:hypothetical protein
MFRLYDFKCPCGQAFEELVTPDHMTTRCACGEEATRLVSAPRAKLDPISGDFPDATRRWAKTRANHIKYERRQASD